MTNATRELGKALCAKLQAEDWCTAPGGGFFVKGHGFVSTARARSIAGTKAEKRTKHDIARTGAAGEWNMVAGLVLAVSGVR